MIILKILISMNRAQYLLRKMLKVLKSNQTKSNAQKVKSSNEMKSNQIPLPVSEDPLQRLVDNDVQGLCLRRRRAQPHPLFATFDCIICLTTGH